MCRILCLVGRKVGGVVKKGGLKRIEIAEIDLICGVSRMKGAAQNSFRGSLDLRKKCELSKLEDAVTFDIGMRYQIGS